VKSVSQPALYLPLVAAITPSALPRPAAAHDAPPFCLTQMNYASDPNCGAHWASFDTRFHFRGEINKSHHAGVRNRFWNSSNRLHATASWEDGLNPNSPWHVHYDTGAPNHIGMQNSFFDNLGWGMVAKEDSNDHIPKVINDCDAVDPNQCDSLIGVWLRHDVWEVSCNGSPCSWYTGTGVPTSSQLDSWGAWMEEIGHGQNISHHIPPGHDTHSHQHTMSGSTAPGSTSKRTLNAHEKQHASDPYDLTHQNCT